MIINFVSLFMIKNESFKKLCPAKKHLLFFQQKIDFNQNI